MAVVVGRNSTVFVNTDYASPAQNDLVEISRYFDAGGILQATRRGEATWSETR